MKYSSIPIFAAMYAVNVSSPGQLPLVSGCQNSGEGERGGVKLISDFWLTRGEKGSGPLYFWLT